MQVDPGGEVANQPFTRRHARVVEQADDAGLVILKIPLQQCDAEVFLGIEVVIERALGHLRAAKDLGQADRREAPSEDQLGPRVQDAVAGVVPGFGALGGDGFGVLAHDGTDYSRPTV